MWDAPIIKRWPWTQYYRYKTKHFYGFWFATFERSFSGALYGLISHTNFECCPSENMRRNYLVKEELLTLINLEPPYQNLYPCPQPKILTITDSMPSVKFFVGIWRQSDKEERFKPDLHAIYSQMDGLAYNLSIRWVISCLRELQDTKEIPPFLTFLHAYLYFIFITVS